MDLIIKNAGLDEILTLCSRLSTPTFSEILTEKEEAEVIKEMEEGATLQEAVETVEKEELHLDGPPVEALRDELSKIGTELVVKKKDKAILSKALKPFGFRAITEVTDDKLSDVLETLRGLNE